MVTSFGFCCADGRGALQSPNCWRSCKVWGKIAEVEVGGDRGMMMEVVLCSSNLDNMITKRH